ncbi:trichome birefringence-like [Striga asiatica]|uniref:Trichome birefringence-like n=1 Tax=Striga asiatica TaxID=4170 RepID=A0A5A7QR86_STRAF|nr:trichome birefringence-like [Striga asiatica]
MFWSPYLVRTDQLQTEPFNLYLDEPDPHWPDAIAPFDYVLLSAEHWFFRPTYFHLSRHLVGCLYCPEQNPTTRLPPTFSYRLAFRTAFRAINSVSSFRGVVFLRTFAPSHFEGGTWNGGGDCVRTEPFGRNNGTGLEDRFKEMYGIQLEELGIARRAVKGNGERFRLFDATRPMMLRPDGHPSRYGHWPGAKLVLVNDCVHWCLPGPIDGLNDLFQELLEREIKDDR